MLTLARRDLLRFGLGSLALAAAFEGRAAGSGFYVCPPCGCAMDGRIFPAPGSCPACGMRLVPYRDPESLPLEPERISAGADAFLVGGGAGREDQRITVHSYLPRSFDAGSPVLLVIPGTGRSGASYRDSWIEAAEKHGVLVAALEYPQEGYDFGAYHMGGVIRDFALAHPAVEAGGPLPTSLYLRDEDLSFTIDPRPEAWLFSDFDRIFALLACASGSTRGRYDLFGHSAGGQILHRLAIFRPRSRADRIVAANAGFYTVPDAEIPLPFGLGGLDPGLVDLPAAFRTNLVLLLGELDNDPDTGGQHLHTPLADRQGRHRLARGRHFFERSREIAARRGLAFEWRLELVPGVGHDQRAMSKAAARLLYGDRSR